MKKYIIYLIFGLMSISVMGQKNSDANIFGHVVNNGHHIAGAHISIKGTQIGTATDKTGHYFLYHLPPGKHTLVVSAVGYKTVEQEIEISEKSTIVVDFEVEQDVVVASEVVITGSRIAQNRKEAPVAVSIITPQSLGYCNSPDISCGLRYQAGLRLENNCQNCGFNQIRMNGLEGQYSQILVDSRPVFSSLSGVYGLEHIPSVMIDRIEIVKGGGSATYGSNAIAGTINVITKEPLQNSFEFGNNTAILGNNSFDNSSLMSASVVNNRGSSGMVVFGNVRNRHAYDHNNDGYSEIPKMKVSGVGMKAFSRLSARNKVVLEYHNIQDYRRGGDRIEMPAFMSSIAEEAEHTIHSGSFLFEHLMRKQKGRISIFHSMRATERSTYYGTDGNLLAYGNSNDLTSFSGLELLIRQDSAKVLPGTILTGVDFSANTLNDVVLGYNRNIAQSVSSLGVFGQTERRLGKLTALLGARADKNSILDEILISPRINLLWSPSELLQLRSGFATGFRAPQTFDEDLHIMAVGGEVQIIEVDPDLEAERSQSFSVSAEFSPDITGKALQITLDGFYTTINNVFVLEEGGTDAMGNFILLRTNADGALVKGVSLELKYALSSKVRLQAGFTLQESLYSDEIEWSEDANAETTKRMLRTPDDYGFFSLIIDAPKGLNVTLSGVYTGSMLVPHYAGYIEADKLEKTESFVDINLKLSKAIKVSTALKAEFSAGVNNMLNSYQNDFDLGKNRDAGFIYGPTLPRHFFIGIKVKA